jgi:CubicO group peptidase (beta-lactamase class C family)
MKSFLTLSLSLIWSVALWAQTGISVPEMAHCDQLVNNFLATYDIPGATFAMAKGGKLVYARGFGEADLAGQELTQPHHLFRIASVSKPITSIAIMKLVETGQLSLSDKVFGSNGLLAQHPYLSTVTYTDTRINDITVRHFLEHSAGWNRDQPCISGVSTPYPWNITHCDPIGFPLYVTQRYGESNPVREEVLIRFLMEEGLEFAPGTQYAYSNIGYLVLGEIIEAVSGKAYETYLQEDIFEPIGICDLHLGKNLLADKQEREGEYHGNGYSALSCYGTGQNVPWEYGGWNLEAMDAHGGWIASARDLVRLLVAVDGFATKPDILSPASVATMTTASASNQYYAKGWSVNASNNWWHTGALDGTASLWARTSNGATWAVILNKRVIDSRANAFWAALDGLPWSCMSQTSTFPAHDLFDTPTQSSQDLAFSASSASSLSLSWTPGDGDQRILVAKAGSPVDRFPLDGMTYQGAASFGQGDDLGNGNFVVYQGSGNAATMEGLDPQEAYHVRVFEYNQRNSTGNQALYTLCHSDMTIASISGTTSLPALPALGIQVFPNPGRDLVQVSLATPGSIDRVELRNLQGQVVKQAAIQGAATTLHIGDLPSQMYLISFFREGRYLGSQRWLKQ